ncbi:MAG: radical SAM protein, partial [Singulisphaera sp.]
PEPGAIAGMFVNPQAGHVDAPAMSGATAPVMPRFRAPVASLDAISSPYTAGILDAADEQMLLLETIRGCIFKCKFCYYPKSYDALYFASRERIAANLAHARERGAREVVLLDPTLNQRRDFPEFVRFLAEQNPQRQFTYFGELRGEGITPDTARLLHEANFAEVEIGLQSVDPLAQQLMDRPNNLKAFERGARAMLAAGLRVKVDLIIGLPGDTAESIRRGIRYFLDTEFCQNVQVFQLSILPGTAFRQEAQSLGLRFQPRPPYYVLETPTLALPEMVDLMREAQQEFGIEFDALSDPVLQIDEGANLGHVWRVDLDAARSAAGDNFHAPDAPLPPMASRAQAFTVWFRAQDFDSRLEPVLRMIDQLLAENPHTTLQIVLEPVGDPRHLSLRALEAIRRTCYGRLSYLDRFYSLAPGRTVGAKRLVVIGRYEDRDRLGEAWVAEVAEYATIVWRASAGASSADLDAREIVIA